MHLLPVLPPELLVQEPVLLVQAPVLELTVLPVLLLEPVLLPEPRRNAALARMHRFFPLRVAVYFITALTFLSISFHSCFSLLNFCHAQDLKLVCRQSEVIPDRCHQHGK